MDTVITRTHSMIHAGRILKGCAIWPDGGRVADNANADLLFRVGGKTAHVIVDVKHTGDAEMYIYEAPTTSADGTEQTIINRKRVGTTEAAESQVFKAPTVTDVGTLLEPGVIPGGTSGGAGHGGPSGGADRFDNEFMFAPNTDYLIRVINRSNGTTMCSINTEFYEGR